MTSRRRTAAAAAASCVLLLTTACGSEGKKADVDDPTSSVTASTIDFDDAQRQAVGHADEVVAPVFGAGARLEPLEDDNPLVTFCSDRSDPPAGTPVRAANDYRVTGADPAQVDAYAKAFEQHWSDAGWKHVDGTLADGGTAWASDDGFVARLTFAASNGLIGLSVSTPCVAPKDPDDPLAG